MEKIFKERSLVVDDIPTKNEVILVANQSNYYKKIKKQIVDQIMLKKFAIIE